ncbi:hypothetical protein BT67DRAFT_178524 [Trichocladium antarcticum]|uniref:Uncharacterized protein n=1 Tax=Trichocladium antarcticum TaxID=1450529 RepID=A0AAN6ZES1_9PEZI|nr:hypothetical protein BT67DRAFT_178524 [Trichocladium antarcticum]
MLTLRGARPPSTPIVAVLVCGWLLVLHFYLQWDWFFPFSNTHTTSSPPEAQLVIASLKHEDTSWVRHHLPSWSHSIYIVDDPRAALTVPKNKGREAMVYLTHLIDAYDTLAPTTVFAHAARFAWHNDDPDYDSLATLRHLNLSHVQAAGYANLRCVWALGCPVEIHPHARASDAGPAAGRRAVTTEEIYKQAFEELMPGVAVPQEVGVSCCSQFAVSRAAVRARPRQDYVRWREWLLETPLADDLSGRVFEYMWHIMFGKDAVFCPSAGECYCKLYGLCNLRCDNNQCDGRYALPGYSTLPDGWPLVGWSGEDRDFAGPL